MKKFYFTFLASDVKYRYCYHVEEAETYDEARQKMTEKFGRKWTFQYDESQWKISMGEYYKFYRYCPFRSGWFEGITQAELFNLKEI